MKLLIDVGNTRLKWCTEEQGSLGKLHAHDYRQPDGMFSLRHNWNEVPAPDSIAIASVSQPAVVTELTQLFQTIWPASKLVHARTEQAAHGVTNAYAQPEKLGVDRWLALLAVRKHYPGAVCVVDCGTAITVDVIGADGMHLGGLICPGLQMMKQALASNTADLSLSDQQGEPRLAINTPTAIANGVTAAAIGLIEQVLLQLEADYQLILTGGDARFLANLLMRPLILDSALVLKGLALFCQRESS